MNLRITGAAFLFAAGLVGQAAAQNACATGTRVAGDALRTLLAGKTVCAALGDDRWQEDHAGNGSGNDDLIDYKRGPGHPVDPAEKVGTWRANSGPAPPSLTTMAEARATPTWFAKSGPRTRSSPPGQATSSAAQPC
jgi:hypothetical protein